MRLLLIFFSLGLSSILFCQTDVDTVFVTDSTGIYSMPQRTCIPIDLKHGYLDSIRVNNQIVNKGGQYYYLKVLNPGGVLILEGNFFDQFPCGTLITYNENGQILDSMNYELIELKNHKRLFAI